MSSDQKQTEERSAYEIEMEELTDELREQHLGFLSSLKLNVTEEDGE